MPQVHPALEGVSQAPDVSASWLFHGLSQPSIWVLGDGCRVCLQYQQNVDIFVTGSP